MENPQPPPRSDAPPCSQGYWHIVAVLMLVVIGSLAYLWFAERNARVYWHDRAVKLSDSNKSIIDVLSNSASVFAGPALEKEKSSMEATIDGRRRGVIMIDESVGRRLGFDGGDVIFVKKAAPTSATGPATQP